MKPVLVIYASPISGLGLLVMYVYSFQRQFDRRKAEECRECGFGYPSTPFSNSDGDAEDHYRGYGNLLWISNISVRSTSVQEP